MYEAEELRDSEHGTLTERLTAPPWAEAAILLLAAVARFWRLDYHSIWFDESVSLKWAQSDPSYIWQVTFPLVQDKHPPLYYLTLHYWQQALEPLALGTNDAALRASGSVLGVLTVAGIMLFVGRISSRSVCLIAGVLVALSPVLVWYSQELRMFQPATTGIVWSCTALFVAWQQANPRRRFVWWLAFVLALVAALYSYLFSAFMLPAAGLTVLWLAVERRSPRFFVEGAVALGVVTLAFLPLANNAWVVNASESSPGTAFAGFFVNIRRLLQVYTVWRVPWNSTITTVTVALYGALAAVGLILPIAGSRKSRTLKWLNVDQIWLTVWLLVPLLVANLMLSRSGSIFDEDRYLLFLAPFALWAVARGIVALGARYRPLKWTAAPAAAFPLLVALPVLWTPAMARENWRAAADYIAEYSRASPALPDAVIAHVDYVHEPLEWYLRQEATFDELPVFFPFGGKLEASQMEDVIAPPLRGLVEFGTHTAWLVQSHLEGVDDQRLVQQWFEQNYPIVTEIYPAGIKLSAFTLQYRYAELPDLAPGAATPEAELAPGLVLAACEIIPGTIRAQEESLHPPSGWVHVRLWWHATDPVDIDYRTTAQVIGSEGIWGDRLVRHGELLDKWPTSSWVPGEYVREEVDINLNPLTPPGQYPVMIGISAPNASDPGSEMVACGEVAIH